MKKATNSQEQAKVGIEDIELRALKGNSCVIQPILRIGIAGVG